ncbi:MAG: hypothetical protein REH83_05520 [Rickettsiella sp.]|nr:hypothetical protein [Rickettsiella sp.]
MNNLTDEEKVCTLISNDLDSQLIDSLVGYETITAYNYGLRLLPYKKLDNEEFKSYGDQATDTLDYWMKNVETPFGNIFLSLQDAFIDNAENVDDLTKYLNNLMENPTNTSIKKEAKEALEAYVDVVKNNEQAINNTNEYVDEFRKKIAEDTINFVTFKTKLPNIIQKNKDEIESKTTRLEETQKEVTELTKQIRETKLKLLSINEDIGKAGIACAIPIANTFGAIAMSVFLAKKSSAQSELERLENDLETYKEKINTINTKLNDLNQQAPLLCTMTAQIPVLEALSKKAAEVAQLIKRSWDNIKFNLANLGELLDKMKQIETLSSYVKKNLGKNFDRKKDAIKTVIEKYNESMKVGIPVDEKAQKLFDLKPLVNSKYYTYTESGLLYLSHQELYEIITNIRNNY